MIIRPLIFLLLIALLPAPPVLSLETAAGRDITITLPAETVLRSLQEMLPLELSPENANLTGQITLQSLERLSIDHNTLSVQGVVGGKDLSMVTTIADQSIRLKLGKVHLPVTCDLHTRFDPQKKLLMVSPTFPVKESSAPGASAIRPLLKALEGKTYPVALDMLKLQNIRIGKHRFPLTMEPVNIAGRDNTLIISLQPILKQ